MRRIFLFLRPRTQTRSSEADSEDPFGSSAASLHVGKQVTVNRFPTSTRRFYYEKTIIERPTMPYHGCRDAPNSCTGG